jgi:hypothetical protein
LTYGRCKVCHWKHAKELNKRLNQGHNAAQLNEWAKTKEPPLSFDRKTLYAHKPHAKHPADALVAYADRGLEVAIPTVTTSEALNALKDIGMANVMADPTLVNPAHMLKAIDLLERQKSNGPAILDIIAKMMVGAKVEHVVTIEGQATEIS